MSLISFVLWRRGRDPRVAPNLFGLVRVELSGGEVFPECSSGSLDKFGVVEALLDLEGGGVAADVLFLSDLPQVGPVADAVDDASEGLLLALGPART